MGGDQQRRECLRLRCWNALPGVLLANPAGWDAQHHGLFRAAEKQTLRERVMTSWQSLGLIIGAAAVGALLMFGYVMGHNAICQ